MGFFDFVSTVYDGVSSAFPTTDVHAEAPPQGGTSTQTPASGTDEESGEEQDVNKADAEKAQSRTDDKSQQGHSTVGKDQEVEDESDKKSEGDDDEEEKEDGGEDEEGGEEEGEEEEDEEEEEPEDPMPKIQAECAESKECAPAKHHYDHCVERVTKQIDDDGKAKEDCVEEFFHLAHCASACAAPKLWRQLK